MKPSGMRNSSPMTGNAGVTIVEEKGDMKVKSDTSIVVSHFLLLDQFNGLLGSFGPSQVIYKNGKYPICRRKISTPTIISLVFISASSTFKLPASY